MAMKKKHGKLKINSLSFFTKKPKAKNFYKRMWIYLSALCISSFTYILALNSPSLNVNTLTVFNIPIEFALAIGIYITVSKINTGELHIFFTEKYFLSKEKSKVKIFVHIFLIVVLGVILKVLLSGTILSFFEFTNNMNKTFIYLCATIVSQIDPIATDMSHFFRQGIDNKSETILRVWSSFDAPITTLLAFYIFLPLTRTGKLVSLYMYLEYFFIIALCCWVVIGLKFLKENDYFLKSREQREKNIFKIESIIVIVSVAISALTNFLLLPALIGLFIRPFKGYDRFINPIRDFIFYFSLIFIGLLAATTTLNWVAGLILSVSVFVAHIIASFLLVRADNSESQKRVLFGHQNGLTAILLVLSLVLSEPEVASILSVTVPTMIFSLILYLVANALPPFSAIARCLSIFRKKKARPTLSKLAKKRRRYKKRT